MAKIKEVSINFQKVKFEPNFNELHEVIARNFTSKELLKEIQYRIDTGKIEDPYVKELAKRQLAKRRYIFKLGA